MADYSKQASETVTVSDGVDRVLEWKREVETDLSVLATPKLPGGSSGYKYDVEDYDVKVIVERFKRAMRIESINVGEE